MGRLHDKAAWHRRARRQLQYEPLCAMCLSEGKIVAARIADHVEPHHNDPIKFWNGKLQSLCAHCHEGRKQRLEHRGLDNAIGSDGWPIRSSAPRAKVFVATKLYKAARTRSIRINKELEERTGLIVLSGHLDHVLRSRDGGERESGRLSWRIGVELDLRPTGDSGGPAGKDRRSEVKSNCSGKIKK